MILHGIEAARKTHRRKDMLYDPCIIWSKLPHSCGHRMQMWSSISGGDYWWCRHCDWKSKEAHK